jgi:hypothetical protein
MFGVIGILVLVIACINFTNLSTARSEKRAREVGIRKVIQSRKALLVLQFTCSIALISGTIVVYQQIRYGLNRPRGYDPDRLLFTEGWGTPFPALKHAVMETGVVSNITQSLSPVTEVYGRNTVDGWPGRQANEAMMPAGLAVAQVLVLITREFIVLVGISCLIASAVSVYFLRHWLDGYYYRIQLGAGVFVWSAVGAIFIALVTVSFQAVKAALMNPVESLRAG